MSTRTLVLAGATGLIGAAVVTTALARGWRVVALVRAGRTLPSRDGLVIAPCDFERLDELRDQIAAHAPLAFISALGTTIRIAGSQTAFARVDLDYVAAFARLGAAAGAERFGLVSSVGADPASGNFYLRTKGAAEAAVRAAGYAHVEIARPSFLMGERAEQRPGEKFAVPISRALSPLLVGSLAIYRPIAAETVARALVAGVERPEPGVFIRHFRELTALAAG